MNQVLSDIFSATRAEEFQAKTDMSVKTITLVTVTAVALFAAVGSAYYLDAREPRQPYPKATPPPPASPVFAESKEPVPTEEEIDARAQDHYALLERQIEQALASRDAQQREMVFTFLLPELLQVEPERVVAMFARQPRGEARDTLRDEIAQQWIGRDRDAAIQWMKSFEDEAERAHLAQLSVDSLASIAPDQAIYVAHQFDAGVDSAYLERLVQSWAEENLPDAERWLASQPDDARTAPLRARIEQVRDQQKPSGSG
jgi:hypothetical protein